MNLYDVIVRVGGSLSNEVERLAITAPEVAMLRALHGEDSVRQIKHVGVSDEPDATIRDRMADFFGTGRVETSRSGPELVKEHFGPKTMRLPDRVDGVEHINPQIGKEVESLTAG
jgi:hypothetical protein